MIRTMAVGITAVGALIPTTAGADQTQECVTASEQGQELAYQHKLVAARDQLRACARTECPAPVAQDCAAQLATLAEQIPTVVLVARSPRGTMASVRVSIDGKNDMASLDGMASEVDPGVHTRFTSRRKGTSPSTCGFLSQRGLGSSASRRGSKALAHCPSFPRRDPYPRGTHRSPRSCSGRSEWWGSPGSGISE